MSTPWYYASLTSATARLKSGEWSAAALIERLLARIDALEPELRGYARVRRAQALELAQQRDAERDAGAPLGLLHGVPVAVKDLLFIEGEIAASGTVVMADYRPSYTATVVTRLLDAGAIPIGQSQLTEGAFGLHHPELPAPRNPWHPDYWTGVSSSGSGAVVAAGLAYAALGTDTGGSIRFPSACCGLVGIKPSYGRVSRYGAWPLAQSLDHIGPMARSVADAARVLQAIAGADSNDATTLASPVPNLAALVACDLRGVRIGVDAHYNSHEIDPEVVVTCDNAAALLCDQGAEIVPVQMPSAARALVRHWSETCGRETAAAHTPYYPAQRDRYGPALRSLIEIGRATTEQRYEALQRVREQFRRQLDQLFEDVDVLLMPGMPRPVPPVDVAEGRATESRAIADYLTFTAPFNYSGHPTLSLPAGLESASTGGAARLPRGLQLVGPMAGEAALVEIGLALEAALNAQFGQLYADDRLPPLTAANP